MKDITSKVTELQRSSLGPKDEPNEVVGHFVPTGPPITYVIYDEIGEWDKQRNHLKKFFVEGNFNESTS